MGIPIVIGTFFYQMKNASILLPSKQTLFEDRGDGEGGKGEVFFEC